MRRVSLWFGALSLAAAAGAQAASITDGGFETPITAAGSYIVLNAGDALGAWTVTGPSSNAVLLLNNTYTEPSLDFHAHSGLNSLDLTGAGNTLFGGIYQDVATTAGAAYTLTFFLGNETGDGSGYSMYYTEPSALDLTIGGVDAGVFTNANVTVDDVNWAKETYTFTATGATTRVAFTNATAFDDNYAGIDDVSIALATPEPATWAMMLLGVAGIGVSIRRSRRLCLAAN